jgi:signal transduction histidine kinase
MADTILPGLLSLASHELRGPTGVVRGYLKMLEQDITLTDRPRRAIDAATQAVVKLTGLLDEMSELGRYKHGSVRLTLKAMSLRSVLSQAVQAVVLPTTDVVLDVVAPADVKLRLDEARLRQVFESLITAVARAQNGPATLELGLTAPRVKGGTAQVVVAIRTIGRAAVIEKPLELTRAGVGLSLPIADSIVAAHGGKLRERWQGGKWAGFVVKL